MSGKNYQDLIAWQFAMDLVEAVYRESAVIPVDERYGLTAQMRRAAVSIPANIAEGQGRQAEVGRLVTALANELRQRSGKK